MAKTTVPSKPTELRGAPRAPADPDPLRELGYRFHRLATSLDGVAGALAMCLDELPADDTKASVLVMLKETLNIWADEARQLSDDVLAGWTPTQKAVA